MTDWVCGRAGRGVGVGAASMLALLIGAMPQVYAQQAPAAQTANSLEIEEIKVTAEHREENERDVPIAISTLTSTAVDEISAGGDDIRFLAARVPSLNIESSFGRAYPRFYIRGLGNSDFTLNAQQPVSIVYDDVALENPILKSFPVFDVQDIEVLPGPQGTLFGRNTPAGVVKIETVRPSDEIGGYADLSYGTFNTVDFNGAVGGPIVKNLLDFRFSLIEERRDDYVTNIDPTTMYHRGLEGYSDFAARGQFLYKPNEDFDALLEFDARALDGTARLFRSNIIEKGTNNLIPGFNVFQVNQDGDNYQNLGTWGTHLTMNDDLGPITLTSISAYEHGSVRSRGDIDGGNFTTPPPIGSPGNNNFTDETSDTIPGLDQVTEELRFSTNSGGRFFEQGGVYYFHEYLKALDFSYEPDGAANIFATQTQSTQSFAVFDSASYRVTDDLTAEAGVRFGVDDKTYSVGCIFGCAVPDPAQVKTNSSQPTFDVSATYAVTPDVNVYGRIATGYLAPALDGRNTEFDGGNPAAGALTEAKAETTTSYEVGLKSALFDHRANFNLAAYSWTTDNIQLTAVGGATNTTILLNATKAIGEGIETSFDIKPIENLLITSNASYNFTQIQDPGLEVAPCAGGCTVQNPIDPLTGNARINGNPLPNAPRWIWNINARYGVPLGNGGEIYGVTDWSYRGTEDFFLYKATEFTGQSLVLGGLRVGYIDHDRGWEVAGFIHNLLDEVKVTGAIDFDNLTGFVNDPRTFGVEGRIRF